MGFSPRGLGGNGPLSWPNFSQGPITKFIFLCFKGEKFEGRFPLKKKKAGFWVSKKKKNQNFSKSFKKTKKKKTNFKIFSGEKNPLTQKGFHTPGQKKNHYGKKQKKPQVNSLNFT